jgi:hypothetical protein
MCENFGSTSGPSAMEEKAFVRVPALAADSHVIITVTAELGPKASLLHSLHSPQSRTQQISRQVRRQAQRLAAVHINIDEPRVLPPPQVPIDIRLGPFPREWRRH